MFANVSRTRLRPRRRPTLQPLFHPRKYSILVVVVVVVHISKVCAVFWVGWEIARLWHWVEGGGGGGGGCFAVVLIKK